MKLPFGFHVVEDGYDPEKAYPRRKAKTWRNAMRPGPCRVLSPEELEKDYGVRNPPVESPAKPE